ncbi:flagellar export chaperone FliS [Thalassotalea sp. G2M2-11]|uniref:flagellar export chaperone FliS n=1 Tax=Thalassotalea sp. G2M2-11 TaxID=2787627 RepID=UPI0019D2403E|nr:flagellar export chaperone FliS [Thalassotalea sp. G2M2-11]
MRKNLKAYKSVDIESNLATADPHQVISMMYNGLLESIAQAKGAIERKELANKSTLLSKAINILQALQNSLDFDSQPEISSNFDGLYGYCIDRINDASVSLDVSALNEVVELLAPLRDAWVQIPENEKQQGLDLLKQKEQAQTNAVGA